MRLRTLLLVLLASVDITKGLSLNLCKKNFTTPHMKKTPDYSGYSPTGQATATVICNDGYMAKPNSTIFCQNKVWTKVECTLIDCQNITPPANGNVTYVNGSTTYKAVAEFDCNEGFVLSENAIQTCTANGSWVGYTPECNIIVSDSESKGRGSDVVIILVVLVVIIVVACAALVIYLRKSGKVCLTKKVGDSEFDQLDIEIKVFTKFRPYAIKRSDFPSYVAVLHKEGNKLFADGFRLLNEESPIHPTTVAESKACKPKTRFSNILPFDETRVKLTPIKGEEGSDFINASFIPGFSSPKEYIATQGPLSETKNDFWRMIWEYNVDLIVMLTQRLETGKGSLPRNYKAERHWVVAPIDQYWPDEVQGPVYYGKFIVQTKSESVLSDYVTRVMEIKLEEEMRTITQIHYLRWPEHGCPRRYWPFINFVTMVRQYMPRQLVVHCSTGVGRTGTFLAVDRLLQHIKANDTVDPYHIILGMRNCRSSMVKTLEQFMYVYECISHFITLEEDNEDEEDDERQYAYTRGGQRFYNNHAFQEE